MKVRVQQLNPTTGDLEGNRGAIVDALAGAEEAGVDLLILPEMVTTGYPAMDLLERPDFLEAVYHSNREIINQTGNTAVIFGSATPNPGGTGRKCFNAAIVARGGEKIGEVHKTLLPTYDVFDDLRYFEPNENFNCIELDGIKLGITICEDIWYNENDIQYHTYEINPARELAEQGADAIINISASPFTKTKSEGRYEMLRGHARSLELPVFYSNQVGANTELVFDGDSMILNAHGEICARAPLFEEHVIDVEWDRGSGSVTNGGAGIAEVPGREERIFKALAKGLKDYLSKTGINQKVLIGLSGGIDSVLVACIAVEALGAGRVTAITMPSQFSSEESVADSKLLAENLGIELLEIPVENIFEKFRETLSPVFKDDAFGVAEENLQPRIRATLLMAVSNKYGYMLLNTGNKSELATGYCTLYGDMTGGLGIISDLYKTEVYEIAAWLNRDFYQKEILPEAVMSKPPSAELRPGQKDTDTLPEYSVLDAILRLYIEKQYSPDDIIKQGFDKQTVNRVINRVDYNEYKRFQAVPGLKISTKAFGSGRRWPVVQGWTKNIIR